MSKVILGCFGFALLRSIIGPENSRDLLNLFKPWEWLASNFSLHYHSQITHEGHENKENDYQQKEAFDQ